jgi:hypothetical protein
MDGKRLAPLSGLVFVVLAVIAVVGIGGSTPGNDASAAKLASFYADNQVRQGLACFILAASVPFLVFFGIALARAASSSEGPTGFWNQVVVAGTILEAGALLVVVLAHFALVDAANNASPGALQALNALDANDWVAFNPALGVLMLGAAGALLTAGMLRWLGWIALPLGIALFIPFADFFALLAGLLWIAVVGIALARRADAPGYVAAPSPA